MIWNQRAATDDSPQASLACGLKSECRQAFLTWTLEVFKNVSVYHFLKDFFMWTIFCRVSLNLLHYHFWIFFFFLMFWVFWPWDLWDLNTPCIGILTTELPGRSLKMLLKWFPALNKSGKISFSLSLTHAMDFFFNLKVTLGSYFHIWQEWNRNGWGMGSPLSLSFCNHQFHFFFLASRGSQLWNPGWSPSDSFLPPSHSCPQEERSQC